MKADIDYYQRLTEVFTFDNTPILAAAAASFVLGYAQYGYAVGLMLRGGRGPIPFWLHSFFLAHDSAWSYVLATVAAGYDYHWFIAGTSLGLAIWSVLEVFCMYRDITTNRTATFSSMFGPRPQLKPILCYVFMMQLCMYGIVIVIMLFMGEGCVMQWFALTNMLLTIRPIPGILQRGSREGLSVGLALVNVGTTVFTFAPFGFFALSIPEIFATPTSYATGVVMFAMSLYGVYVVASYPPKKRAKYGPKPIW